MHFIAFFFFAGLNDPRNIFRRHTSEDGRRIFVTVKQLTSTSGESDTPETPGRDAANETSNGFFCVDMIFRYKDRSG